MSSAAAPTLQLVEPDARPAQDPPDGRSGFARAALVLSFLQGDEAERVCKEVGPDFGPQLRELTQSAAQAPESARLAALRALLARVRNSPDAGPRASQKAEDAVEPLQHAREDLEQFLDKLKLLEMADPNLIWRAISGESPQAISIIARQLSVDNCAKLLQAMPEEIRGDVVLRMADPSPATHGALKAFARVADSLLKVASSGSATADGSLQFVAETIQRLNRKAVQDLLADVKGRSQEIGAIIEKMIFRFTDLLQLPAPSLQALLRGVSTSDLALALKGVPEEMRDTVFNNLSERARTVLQEEMDLLGPVPASEAERAQMEIVQMARALEAAGELVLESGDVEYVD
jgi:flagellar motor switch protein FliG